MVFQPTLKYPNGGEVINSSTMTIEWTSQSSSDGRASEFEIFYTDVYNIEEEPDWIQIATVPGNVNSYIWTIPSQIRSSMVRIAIRTTSYRGEKSDYSISANNFTIRRRNLIVPNILSPVSGSTYDKYIEIIPDYSSISGTYSQRSYLQFSYSSNKLGIPLTSIAENVPVYTSSIIWNTLELQPSDDYIIYVQLFDNDGSDSDIIQIDVEIIHQGYFLIDTTPPVSNITINNNNGFTRTQDIGVNIVSFDETTGVHSMQLIEGTNIANPEPVANVKSFTLSSGDGIKVVELLLQDYGANRNNNQIYHLFDNVITDNPVIDFTYLSDGSLWAIVGTEKSLYKIVNYPILMLSMNDEPTAITNYNNQIYIATVNVANQSTLNRYTGASSVETIMVFNTSDSNITTMTNYNNSLYLGMENGSVYQYDGTTISFIEQLSNPILLLNSDGSSLYLVLENDNTIYRFSGGTFVEIG